MYVCLCNGVTDKMIREAAHGGVKSMRELRMQTGCASTCGCCAETAQQILAEETQIPVLRVVQDKIARS